MAQPYLETLINVSNPFAVTASIIRSIKPCPKGLELQKLNYTVQIKGSEVALNKDPD